VADTYSGDPASSDKDWVRFAVGDTSTPSQFSDEEIAAAIAHYGGKEAAAAGLLQMMAIRLAREPDFKIGRFSESRKSAIDALNEKAKEVAAQAHAFGFYAGGISVADKAARAADSDRPPAKFFRGMMQPSTGSANDEGAGE